MKKKKHHLSKQSKTSETGFLFPWSIAVIVESVRFEDGYVLKGEQRKDKIHSLFSFKTLKNCEWVICTSWIMLRKIFLKSKEIAHKGGRR